MTITRRNLQLGFAALMIIGAIGPWAKLTILGTTVTANGFDRDGLGVVICAVIIAANVYLIETTDWLALFRWLAAIAATAICVYDYFDIAGKGPGVSVGWGLWLAMLTSVAFLISLVITALETTNAPADEAGEGV